MRMNFLVPSLGLFILVGCQPKQPVQPPAVEQPAYHSQWFVNQPVLGQLPEDQQEKVLAEIYGEKQTPKTHGKGVQPNFLGLGGDPNKIVYTTTDHEFGFAPTLTPGANQQIALQQAATITPDVGLKNAKIKITLDQLRVLHYPGNGRHNILFTFHGQNQVAGVNPEEIDFSQNYEVMEGQGAGIAGYPVFIGLNVGSDGVSFKGHTINVSNDNDEKFLSFLSSSTVTNGLKLLDTVNPAIPVVSQFATGIATAIGSRNKNIGVQDFFLGLDFASTASGARLAQGSYIVVQAPKTGWNWGDWVWDTNVGGVVKKSDKTPIPWNYVVFSVTKM
jgi:hypothetical protein